MPAPTWEKIGSAEPASEKFYGKQLIRQKFLRTSDNTEHLFYFYDLPSSVVTLAITEDGNALLLKEYMQGAGEDCVWLGGGIMKKDETPEAAAARELTEESGYVPERVISLGHTWIVARHCPARVHIFLALGCKPTGEQNLDPQEEIEMIRMPVQTLFEQLVRGEIADNFTATALLRALPYLGLEVPK